MFDLSNMAVADVTDLDVKSLPFFDALINAKRP